MIQIREYLTTKIVKSTIKATNDTIKQITKEEMDKYGHDCDLNHVDVSEVTIMYFLFSCYRKDLGESYSDSNPDISEWDVGNVTNMKFMFYGCRNFNCNISNWNISNVTDMNSMFYLCNSFNQNLSTWNVENVQRMDYMFYKCTSFNQDLSMWNVNNGISRNYMFANCPIKEEFKPKFK